MDNNVDVITSPTTSFYAVSTFLLISVKDRHRFHLNSTARRNICPPAPLHVHCYMSKLYGKFSQSLEARPRSIYDVLDHSTVNREPDRSKAKQKKKEPGEPVSVDFSCFVMFLRLLAESNATCSW